MTLKHVLLAVCCLGVLIGFPMITAAEDAPLEEAITIEPVDQSSDSPFADRKITGGINDEHDGDTTNKNNTDTTIDDDADVGICVVGAGGPCN